MELLGLPPSLRNFVTGLDFNGEDDEEENWKEKEEEDDEGEKEEEDDEGEKGEENLRTMEKMHKAKDNS